MEKLDSIPEENYQALDLLLLKGKTLFVLTSRTYEEMKHLLAEDHPLFTRIKGFYYQDNTEFYKPDPRIFKEALVDSGLTAQVCVYVGDSIGDAIAAKGAGLKFIASLESSLRSESDFATLDANACIKSFSELALTVTTFESA